MQAAKLGPELEEALDYLSGIQSHSKVKSNIVDNYISEQHRRVHEAM